MKYTTKAVIFDRPYEAEQMTYEMADQANSETPEAHLAIKKSIARWAANVGMSETPPSQWSPEMRAQITQLLYQDLAWQEASRALIGSMTGDTTTEPSKVIYKPDWATLRLTVASLTAEPGSLRTVMEPDHSYMSQYAEHCGAGRKPTSSTGGLIYNNNGNAIITHRAGQRYNGVHHMIAGFLDYPANSDLHPLVASWEQRQINELNLAEGSFTEPTLIGWVITDGFQKDGTIDFVFSVESQLSSDEIRTQANTAVNSANHRELIEIAPANLLRWLDSQGIYNPNLVDPNNPAQTTHENMNTIMPHGALSLIGDAVRNGHIKEENLDGLLKRLGGSFHDLQIHFLKNDIINADFDMATFLSQQ